MNLHTRTPGPDPVECALAAMSQGDTERAAAIVRAALDDDPLDTRLHVVHATLAAYSGDGRAALEHLWRGLAAEPGHAFCRQEFGELLVPVRTDPGTVAKNFEFDSGERQTATEVEAIRADHRERYAFAARWLRAHLGELRVRTGIDAFAGNGYGSRMLADLCGARMVGIDGSAGAVEHAERCFGDHRVVFVHAVYPFALRAGMFDFAVCFESIEHVDDPLGLLEQLRGAASGPIVVSVPNERALPFATFGARFEHHVRHFRMTQLQALMSAAGWPRMRAAYGQDVYAIEHGDIAGLLPEHRMRLHAVREDSQFLVCAFDTA